MPWPNDVVTRTVFGTYVTGLGSPAQGRITFTPTSRVVDEDDAVIIENTISIDLDEDGAFSVDLPTTDNALLYPKGWAYDVRVKLYGVKPQRFFAILPIGDGTPVDIRDNVSLADTNVSPVRSSTGARGPAGPRGPGTLISDGLPESTDGFDGDIYIDSEDGSFYGPKVNGEWPEDPTYVLSATKRKVHLQGMASSVWSITHDLGGRPSVTVVDSAGTVVIGEIGYNSDTEVTITFTAPFSGAAYLT